MVLRSDGLRLTVVSFGNHFSSQKKTKCKLVTEDSFAIANFFIRYPLSLLQEYPIS